MKPFVAIVLGTVIGAGAAVYRISHWSDADATIVNGAWNANRHMEMGKDRLLTARIATAATFALDPSEAVYMVADGDSERRKFDAAYDYVIEGNAAWLNARYWSITLYAPDFFLVPNDEGRFSFNMMNTTMADDGSFRIVISPQQRDGDWLPSVQEGAFYLLLRLYHPEPVFFEHLDNVPLPVITRVERS
jgi:hypothetical protein